jgi:arsenate reductase-like glutaredoxin family protein
MKTNKKIKELNQQIDDNCNSFISKRLLTSSTTYNNDTQQQCVSMSNTNNNFDSNKIEQLYQQYKKRPAKIQKIKQTADIESGITFEPYVNRNSKYYDKINTNVIERTERTIEHKKKFVNDINKAEEQLRKEQQYGYKKYTQNEKEEITQRIIHRLYGRGYLKCNYAKKANGNYSPIEIDDEQYNYMDNNNNDEGIISNGMGDV